MSPSVFQLNRWLSKRFGCSLSLMPSPPENAISPQRCKYKCRQGHVKCVSFHSDNETCRRRVHDRQPVGFQPVIYCRKPGQHLLHQTQNIAKGRLAPTLLSIRNANHLDLIMNSSVLIPIMFNEPVGARLPEDSRQQAKY